MTGRMEVVAFRSTVWEVQVDTKNQVTCISRIPVFKKMTLPPTRRMEEIPVPVAIFVIYGSFSRNKNNPNTLIKTLLTF